MHLPVRRRVPGLNWTKVGLKDDGALRTYTVPARLNWTKVGLKENHRGPAEDAADRFELD